MGGGLCRCEGTRASVEMDGDRPMRRQHARLSRFVVLFFFSLCLPLASEPWACRRVRADCEPTCGDTEGCGRQCCPAHGSRCRLEVGEQRPS